MAEIKKSSEARDYKERFEFRLTVGDNIICQRYFKINNFNLASLRSFELADTIRSCAMKIHNDLVDKTQVYLSILAPRVFNSVEEMNEYLSKPENQCGLNIGEGIVVVGSDVDYFWDGKEASPAQFKFDDGEFYRPLTKEDEVEYKFAFYVDEKEACSAVWTGIYPKYVRNSIDLSNKRGRFDDVDKNYTMSFEQCLMYKLVEGRKDLVWGLIKDICYVCSLANEDRTEYTIDSEYHTRKKGGKIEGTKTYRNILSKRFLDRR
jgi:hypothetical protein